MHPKWIKRLPHAWSVLPLAALIAFIAVSASLLGTYQQAEAAASGSSAFNINAGQPVVVGQTVPWSFTVTNTSDEGEANETITVTSIVGYPSCDVIDLSDPAPCQTAVANQNPGTFTPVGNGTGTAGTACEGITFTIAVDGSGLWTFTPNVPVVLGSVAVGGALVGCQFTGLATVDSLPDDASAVTPGVQTRQLSRADGVTDTSLNEFIGLGSAIVTVNEAAIDVTKTPNVTQTCVPGDVTYTFVVSNPGTIALENVTVSDNVLGNLTATFVAANGGSSTLAAGATVNFQVVHAAALGAVTNIVTASGVALGVTATDTATATVTGYTCDIDVTKTPSSTLVCVGDSVTYTFVVSNPGTIALDERHRGRRRARRPDGELRRRQRWQQHAGCGWLGQLPGGAHACARHDDEHRHRDRLGAGRHRHRDGDRDRGGPDV
jgi:uncharacterized repeat protein (TIGR01451 family)